VTVDITVLIAVLGFALSVGTFFVGRMTAAKTDGIADGETKANIRYIKESVDKHDRKLDRVAENYESVRTEIVELRGRLEKLEQRVEMLHEGE
jgi:polyhydroxyalkanoate synthesis regulator phasin